MTGTWVNVSIALAGVLLSIVGAVWVAGVRWGVVQQRLDQLERTAEQHATKADVANLRESMAEIRGMFRLELRQDGGNRP